jgi:hypothetical protein
MKIVSDRSDLVLEHSETGFDILYNDQLTFWSLGMRSDVSKAICIFECRH